MSFRAVCFDLGGVLIQIHHTWDDAIEASGVQFSRADIGPLGGFETFEQYQDGQIDRSAYLTDLKLYLGVGSVEDAHKVHMAITRETYPGIDHLVRELCDAGHIVGCLSNTSESHWETFFEAGNHEFGPLMQVRIGSHLVKSSKPVERIYRAFEEASQCQGEEIIYFDDSLLNVEAAKGLGWQAHQIDPDGDTAEQIRSRLSL